MNFSELDPKVQDKVRSWQLDYDWWDNTYQDIVRMGEILGITIYDRVVKSVRGKPIPEPDIYFDLGRSMELTFDGRLAYAPEACTKIRAETNDEVLIGLADRIATVFVTMRMKDMPVPYILVRHRAIEIDWEGWEGDVVSLDQDIRRIIFDFKTWAWNCLNDESDYLTSDECLSDYDYEADGSRI